MMLTRHQASAPIAAMAGRIHVLYAHGDSWLSDHALEALHRVRGCSDGEQTSLNFYELDSISRPQSEGCPYLSRDCDSTARSKDGGRHGNTYEIGSLHSS